MKITNKRTTETHRTAPKTCRIRFSPAYLAICLSFGILPQARAGHTYFGINYQYYRDFAENKGKFAVGAKDIEVYNKKGELVGKSMTKAPMIDFSVVSRNGVAALVGDQYIVSVAHNVGYRDVDFGAEGGNPDQHRFSYKIAKRNNYKNDETHPYEKDYHNPRLHKFVTEAAPIDMTSDMDGNKYTDRTKYPERVRIGSGWQFWRNDQDKGDQVAGAYHYLTAGNTHNQGGAGGGWSSLSGDVRQAGNYGPIPIAGSSGDSGSPMFIYDAEKQKWLINGVLRTGNPWAGKENTFQLVRKSFFDEILEKDLRTSFYSPSGNGAYTITDKGDGSGIVKQQTGRPSEVRIGLKDDKLPAEGKDDVYQYQGPNIYLPRLNNGGNLYFGDQKNGTVTLSTNINQGAGGLYFEGNFTVSPENNETWQGAGIHTSEGSTVTWKVNGVANDRLSKIGKGTLLVQAKGENQGSISVGDGKVILDQQADENNKKQAFSEIGLVSGRGTVQLNADNQFNPDKLYFGFRGGRLDLNGHSLSFHRIQNTDEGAMIVNHNQGKESTVTITGNKDINTTNNNNSLDNKKEIAYNGWFGEKDSTKTNGRLNLNYQPAEADRTLLLSGGTNLNGNITQTNGKLFFSGRPTPHAYNHLGNGWSKMEGIPQGEIVWDNDWINRTFKAENFLIKGGQAVISRNVSNIEGNWTISNNANTTFGVVPNQENTICTRSDWTGLTTCRTDKLTDEKTIKSLPRTQVKGNVQLSNTANLSASGLVDLVGNVTLTNQSQFTLSNNATQTGNIRLSDNATATVDNATLNGDVHLTGSSKFSLKNSHFSHQIQGGEGTAAVLENADWTMPGDTVLQNLTLNNSTVTLNSAYPATGAADTSDTPRRRRSLEPEVRPTSAESRFNTLTVNGKLNGQGTFRFMSELFGYRSDKLKLAESSEGTYTLAVNNTGNEPVSLEQLTVVEGKDNKPLSENLNFTLQNEHVDAGAWRYQLIRKDGEFRLYNPVKEQELSDKLDQAGKTEAALAEKQAQLAAKQQEEEEKVRLKKAEISGAVPSESELNRLNAELEEAKKQTAAAQAAQAEKEAAWAQAKTAAAEAGRRAEEADAGYRRGNTLEGAENADAANLALAKAQIAEQTAKIDWAEAKLTRLNRIRDEREKAVAAAGEAKALADKIAETAKEKQDLQSMVLSLANVKEELVITEAELQNAKAEHAGLEAKWALLERRQSDKVQKEQEAQTALTAARQSEAAREGAAEAKKQAEKDNAQSLDALNAAGRDAAEKAESVAELARQAGGENAGIMQAEEEKKRAQTDKDTALEKQREAETRPVTAAFRRARRDLPQPQPQPQRDLISRYANSGLSEFSATLNSVFAVQDELDRVFAEDRRNAVWTSGIRDTKHYRSQDFRAYRQQTDLRQIGMQKNLGSGRVGILFSHNRTENTFDDSIGNSARLAHSAVFGQYGIGRFDIGISAGAGFSSGSLSDGIGSKIRRRVLHYGIQARYRAGFGGFGIEPYIGATRYFVQKADYRYENVNIATPGLAFNRYRAGIKADYSFKPAQHISITPYLSLSYTDAASGKVRTRVNTAVLAQDFGKTRSAEWGVNAEIKGFTLSLHAAAAKGPQLEAQHSAGIKLGYRW
ncbi:adhesion and penetration autotransporter App [Neisseria bergeri]|uniref:adhesion and penetration autotransporter App n=1 Tax=Neisseria bergeri TaxID=1906581 RepID=UPI0027E0CB53|nr:adhesion and penetration autotransporter App [Neisseria bergeri]